MTLLIPILFLAGLLVGALLTFPLIREAEESAEFWFESSQRAWDALFAEDDS